MIWTRGSRRADGWIIHRSAPDFASISVALAQAGGHIEEPEQQTEII